MGFSRFAALLEEQISDKISRRILSGDQGMVVWWSIVAGVHVEQRSNQRDRRVWLLRGMTESALGSKRGVCPGVGNRAIQVHVNQEAFPREDTIFISFFAPPATDFVGGNKPAYISEG